MPLTTERGRIAHLLRRAGFSPSAVEIDAAVAKGRDAVIDELLHPERVTDDAETLFPLDGVDYARPTTMRRWWIGRMVTTRRPLQEKMTLFWHTLLTSSLTRVNQLRFTMVNQNEFFRRNALGSFRDLILGVSKEPAMIRWLDNDSNKKGKPNENYARELFELFTLGRGNYSEQDIREAARAFTGWTQRDGVFLFQPGQHDNDAKTVFGRTGNLDGGDICAMAVEHAAAGPYIARRLWRFFAYENPEQGVIDQVASVYSSSGFDIRAVMRAILTHQAFYSEKAYHAVVKSPTEIIAGFFRALEARIDPSPEPEAAVQMANQISGISALMGQSLFAPETVEGWLGGQEWVSSTAMISRYNFASIAARDGYATTTVDVAGLLARHNLTELEPIVDFLIDVMVDGDLTASQRQALLDYMVKADNGSKGTFKLDERTINNKVRGLIHLIGTTPQYQMA